jgi:curved DNA-binding protein CbpA
MTNLTPSATGTLEDSPMLHLLVSALEQGTSGTLVIETPSGSRSALLLARGIPTKLRTAEPVERFGSVLVKLGWLDEHASETSFEEASAAGKLHGEYLTESGVLNADIVARGLRQQMLRKLLWACSLEPKSVYGLYEDRDFLARWAGAGTPISPLHAIWQLTRAMEESSTLNNLVGRFESQAMRIHPRAVLEKFGFDAAERALLDALKARPQTVSELKRLNILSASMLHRAIYVLALTRQFELGGISDPMGVGSRYEDIHELLEQRKSRPSRPVTIGATPAVPSAATEKRVSGSIDPNSVVTRENQAQSPEVVERRRALNSLAASYEQLDYYQLLGIDRDANSEQVQAAFFRLAKQLHPDKLGAELSDLHEIGARIFSHLTDAQQTLTDSHRRADYDRQLTLGPSAGDDEQERIQVVVHAATSFQKAEVLFKKRMFAAAEIEAKHAHENDPEQSDYLALLAWIRANKPNSEAQLPQILDKLNLAVKMGPESEKNRFYRAQVLSRLGRHREALADYRFVVSKNPHHIDALRELRIWEMRRKGQESTPPVRGSALRSSSPPPAGSRRPSDPRHPARTSTTPTPNNHKSQNPTPKGGVLSKFFKR